MTGFTGTGGIELEREVIAIIRMATRLTRIRMDTGNTTVGTGGTNPTISGTGEVEWEEEWEGPMIGTRTEKEQEGEENKTEGTGGAVTATPFRLVMPINLRGRTIPEWKVETWGAVGEATTTVLEGSRGATAMVGVAAEVGGGGVGASPLQVQSTIIIFM